MSDELDPRRPLPSRFAAAGAGAAAIALLLLGGLAVDGSPFAFDRAIILGLRLPGDLATPIGPAWLKKAMIDITALGSVTVLMLVTLAVGGLLLATGRRAIAWLTVGAAFSGALAVELLKLHVGRARPTLVPHLVEVGGNSFPSGHSAASACIYLTIAALAGEAVPTRAARRYLFAAAVILVGAIGVSRVFLGVHWPSDVMAGWSFGTLWALCWWKLGAQARAAAG